MEIAFPQPGRHLSGGKRCCHAPFWVSLWSERLFLLPALASGRVERRLWKTEPVLMRWETLEVDPKVHPLRCKSLLRNRTHPVPHKNTGPVPPPPPRPAQSGPAPVPGPTPSPRLHRQHCPMHGRPRPQAHPMSGGPCPHPVPWASKQRGSTPRSWLPVLSGFPLPQAQPGGPNLRATESPLGCLPAHR